MDNQEKTWQDYLFIFYRRRWIWLLAFLSVSAAVAVFTFIAQPIYEAKTSLLIDVEERMQTARHRADFPRFGVGARALLGEHERRAVCRGDR